MRHAPRTARPRAGTMIIEFSGRRPSLKSVIPMAQSTGSTLILDASRLTWASPMDLTGIAAWATVSDPPRTELILPELPDLSAYLSRMDVLRRLQESGATVRGAIPSNERADLADRLIEVRCMSNE